MKRVYDDIVYDTNTAKELFFWDNGQNPKSPFYVSKTLCVTPEGYYFELRKSGDPISPITIFPMYNEVEAAEFIEEHGGNPKEILKPR